MADLPTPKPSRDPLAQAQQPDHRRSAREEIAHTSEKLMPWAISILLHLSIALIAVFAVWSMQPPVEAEDDVKVDVTFTVPDPSDALFKPEQLQTDDRQPFDEPSRMASKAVDQQRDPTDPNLIGLTGYNVPTLKPRPDGLNTDTTWLRPGTGNEEGPGREKPPTPDHQPAQSIVYVIDASGSMVDSFVSVQKELLAAIRNLNDDQRFTILFFQQDTAIAMMPAGLHRATKAAKQQAIDSVGVGVCKVQPRGSSNPVKALQLAIAYRPDAIVLLSDNITGSGRYSVELADLLAMIERTKTQRGAANTRIHTVQFLRPDPQEALRRIAEATGGGYRFVAETQLR